MLLRLNQAQLDKLADFFVGLAVISSGSLAVSTLFQQKFLNPGSLLYAIIITVTALIISLALMRNKYDKN